MSDRTAIVILGAGPAGLAAAWKLAKRGTFDVTVIERRTVVGGNAGSFELDGQRVDYGSHRLHPACLPPILADIRSMLGGDLLNRPRHGRIRLRGRWLHFPLKPANLALHLPPSFALGILRDVVRKPDKTAGDDTFASVLEQKLGPTICRDFYFPYAQKIWGLAASELDGEQARRRVSAGSMSKMLRRVLGAVPGLKPKGSGRFFYPRHGYGQISEAYYCAALQAGANVRLGETVQRIEIVDGRLAAVTTRGPNGESRLTARHVLSTIPLPALVRSVVPAAPAEVLASAAALKYRAMVLAYLIVETDRFSEFDAHYFPGPDVMITRLSEPKNYSLAGRPDMTVLCAELPCAVQDEVWESSDEQVGKLVMDSLTKAGLPIRPPLRDVVTRRLSHAYPIYTRGYHDHFERLDTWVSTLEGLTTFGRQGLFAHDNTHHTLAMAYAASECLDAAGTLDRARWTDARQTFETHVVED